jgi:hypothetical protein
MVVRACHRGVSHLMTDRKQREGGKDQGKITPMTHTQHPTFSCLVPPLKVLRTSKNNAKRGKKVPEYVSIFRRYSYTNHNKEKGF